VQVSPSLIDVTSGTDVWQQPFDAPLQDVFTLQSDIAGRVVQSLGVALSPGARQNLTERPTANLAAYDAYLKGEEVSAQGTAGILELERAATHYKQAIALDSSFASAWARLGMVEAAMVFVGGPTPERDSLAREAADRAAALAPGQPDTYMAQASYDADVQGDNHRALAEMRDGIKAAPSNVLLWSAMALAQQNLGQWDSAVADLRRAEYLDPRDAQTARRLATTYVWLRRYPEASAAIDRALTLSPTNPSVIEARSIVALARGDLAAAQAAMRAVPASVDSVGLAAFYANYWDFYWVPDENLQKALVALPPAAFGGDRAPWGIVRAEVYAMHGDARRSRVYADSAVQALREALRSAPQDWQSHALLGLMYGYLGRKADAIREGEDATRAVPISQDGYSGTYYEALVARTYTLVGEQDKAIDALTQVLRVPFLLNGSILKIDPDFASLRSNPRFQALVAEGP
jgi:tetratricopeptide (TPR) repeat protein